jgi:putative transposase
MQLSYKFRLLPTRGQETLLDRALWACRRLHNAALAQRIIAWRSDRKSVGFAEQSRELPALMAAFEEFKAVQHHVLQKTLRRLDRTFAAFFRGAAKFPRFKGRNRFRTLEFDPTAFRLDGDRVRLSKVGMMRFVKHRDIPAGARVKMAYVKRDALGDWWVSFPVVLPDAPKREVKTAVGVDLGLINHIATSEGTLIGPPKPLLKSLKKLGREQRRFSRRKKGGKNRERQRVKVAKVHRKIERQRSDWLHKASGALVRRADLVVFEDLRVANMVRNRSLARSIMDAAWAELVRMTTYKAEGAGGAVVRVEARGSSRECSWCGETKPELPLSERVYRCGACGLALDRDVNAARVILKRGLAEYGGRVKSAEPALVPTTAGTAESHACGDRASTAANAAASPVAEAGSLSHGGRHPL